MASALERASARGDRATGRSAARAARTAPVPASCVTVATPGDPIAEAAGSTLRQKSLRVSSRMVTGPSLTSSTAIWARNTPVATGSPFSRSSAQTRW